MAAIDADTVKDSVNDVALDIVERALTEEELDCAAAC